MEVDLNIAHCVIAILVILFLTTVRKFRKLHEQHEALKKAHSNLSIQFAEVSTKNDSKISTESNITKIKIPVKIPSTGSIDVIQTSMSRVNSATRPFTSDSPIMMSFTTSSRPPIAPIIKTSFSRIFSEGLPSIPTKNTSFNLTSKSKISFQQRDMKILHNIAAFNHTEEVDSVLLLTVGNYQKLKYVSEIDITDLVKTLLSDVMSAAKLNHKLFLFNEAAGHITQFRFDLWGIYSDVGVPVGLVVIKEPSVGITSNLAVLESVYEDMVLFRCLYGVRELFAIVTTYDEWNICWLSDTDKYASQIDTDNPPGLHGTHGYASCIPDDVRAVNGGGGQSSINPSEYTPPVSRGHSRGGSYTGIAVPTFDDDEDADGQYSPIPQHHFYDSSNNNTSPPRPTDNKHSIPTGAAPRNTTTSNTTSGESEEKDDLFNNILLNKNNNAFNDILYGTGTMRYNDPKLVPTLITTVRKMYHAHIVLQPIGGPDRICILAKSFKNWSCAQLPSSIRKLSLVPPVVGTDEFYLLRDYRGGRDGRVWLACDALGHMCVIKFCHPEDVDSECLHWNEIYGDEEEEEEEESDSDSPSGEKVGIDESRPIAYVTQLLGVPALIMPVAFHVVEELDGSTHFDTHMRNWTWELNTSHDHLNVTDAQDVSLVEGYQTCLDMLTLPENDPYAVAVRAIEHIARNHYVHDDVEFRHVALLPVVKERKSKKGEDEEVLLYDKNQTEVVPHEKHLHITLKPIMIDLSGMTGDVQFRPARDAMMKLLDELPYSGVKTPVGKKHL